MSDLEQRLGELDQLDTPDMRAAIDQRAARLRAEPTTPGPVILPAVSPWRGTVIAIGTATAILVMAVTAMWLVRRGPSNATNPATPLPTTVPFTTLSGVRDGQVVGVTVSGVSGHAGHDLAGVLYTGGELTDLDREALGGFWSVISGEDYTTTEVVREPGDGMGRFPFVSDEALAVEPGTYTLVLWVDVGLGPASRWVPVNTDGRGLYGCHAVFEVGEDTQTDLVISPNLHADGWNIDCTTGQATPGTNSGDPVNPRLLPAPGTAESSGDRFAFGADSLIRVVAIRSQGGELFSRLTDESDIRRGDGSLVAVDSVVDGVFLDESHQWDEGAVWWEGGAIRPTEWWMSGTVVAPPDDAERRWFELSLDGVHHLEGAVVQADDNDSYLLSYRDPDTGGWVELWQVPPVYWFGMQTRYYTLNAPITTDAVRFEAHEGDGMYSVSEIQLYGRPAT